MSGDPPVTGSGHQTAAAATAELMVKTGIKNNPIIHREPLSHPDPQEPPTLRSQRLAFLSNGT